MPDTRPRSAGTTDRPRLGPAAGPGAPEHPPGNSLSPASARIRSCGCSAIVRPQPCASLPTDAKLQSRVTLRLAEPHDGLHCTVGRPDAGIVEFRRGHACAEVATLRDVAERSTRAGVRGPDGCRLSSTASVGYRQHGWRNSTGASVRWNRPLAKSTASSFYSGSVCGRHARSKADGRLLCTANGRAAGGTVLASAVGPRRTAAATDSTGKSPTRPGALFTPDRLYGGRRGILRRSAAPFT